MKLSTALRRAAMKAFYRGNWFDQIPLSLMPALLDITESCILPAENLHAMTHRHRALLLLLLAEIAEGR